MKRSAFGYLYIHANSLAELGLEQFAAGVDLGTPDCAGLPVPGSAEREAMALEQLRNMDMSSMREGFSWETAELDAAMDNALHALQTQAALAEGAAEAPAGAPGPAGYLEQAYAAAFRIAQRIDAAMARADMSRLDALVAAMPDDLPPLTGALREESLGRWLACYQAGHPALVAIISLVRGLEFGR